METRRKSFKSQVALLQLLQLIYQYIKERKWSKQMNLAPEHFKRRKGVQWFLNANHLLFLDRPDVIALFDGNCFWLQYKIVEQISERW